MAQALHSGFHQLASDPMQAFVRLVPTLLDIESLVAAFADALAGEGATGHRCFAVDENDGQVLLTQFRAAVSPKWRGGSCVSFSIEMPGDEPLIVEIDTPEPCDRHRRARLHLLAVAYANHAAILIEAEAEGPPAGSLSPAERHCLLAATHGLSYLDIGEDLDLSPPAVGVLLRRAAVRLGVSSISEACAISLRQGLLNPDIS